MDIRKQAPSKVSLPPKIRSYSEVVEYLDKHWYINNTSKTLDRVKQLDAAFGHPSKKISTLLVAGTNGKSTTIHLTAKLLKEEGLNVGIFSSPHMLTYNERFTTNHETIANKTFTDIGNDVINRAESLEIEAYSYELLTIMALLYFVNKKVDVALLEVNDGGTHNAVNICNALVATITRVTPRNLSVSDEDLAPLVTDIMGIVKKGTWLVSGDQNKGNLELMQTLTDSQGGHWAMPIRKLAPLAYPFEQLHGRCAALAERIAQMFLNHYFNKNATITVDSLLSRKKSKRGRPTLEDKQKKQPIKTVEEFWKDELSTLPGRFEILKEENPSIILDTASNLDAFKNILLGLRLIHYQRPFKGLAIVMAAAENTLHNEEFLKLVRYFFKKTPGQIFLCPLEPTIPGVDEEISWNVEKITNNIKSMKVKARAFSSFQEAFEAAKQAVDKHEGMICITGSRSIVTTYLNHTNKQKA